MKRREISRLLTGLAFLTPWLIGFLLFTLIPVALSFYYSLCDYSLLEPPLGVGLANYRELAGDPIFWKAVGNTLHYTAIALPAALLVSLGLALLLNAPIRGQAIYRTLVFLPSLVPVAASAIVWLWLFNTRLGLINGLLAWIGLRGPGWLTTPEWALPSLALMSLWGVGHATVIYLAGLQNVPRELYEAAELDGAGPIIRLRAVTLPLLSPVIFFNLITAMIGAFQVFAVPYIMTGGGPARSTYFYVMYLYDNAFVHLRMGYASAMAWVLLVIILALTGLAFGVGRRLVRYQGN